MELLQQGLALATVFGLLAGGLWFLKNRQSPILAVRGQRRMQVIERVALSPQHALCLVKVDERVVIIGTAPSSCQLIEVLEERA